MRPMLNAAPQTRLDAERFTAAPIAPPVVLLEMAELLPPLTGEQFATLEADLLKNGCYSPIVVNEDLVIIDGHNRQRLCEKHGLPCAVPDDAAQAAVMDVIYGDIKQGRPADMAAFERAAASLRAQGCDRAILGCTELSLIKRDEGLGAFYLDSMEVLARNAILAFGKTPIGFD